LHLPYRAVHLARWDSEEAAATARNASSTAGPRAIVSSFYAEALGADDQLRQRMAFALSEIFVVSTQSLTARRARAVASYMDMLSAHAFDNYRNLLEAVALHPAMGQYLSHLKNEKENPATGRQPDQNFAREVMQLFSIGLVQLNPDGSVRTDAGGQPLPTYTQDDIIGLSKVFTGFSWAGADTSRARFLGRSSARDPEREALPMQPYADYHSMSDKRFLGTTIAANTVAEASLRKALDTLAAHPNVGPFLGRQLIQRLVTSNPSPAYVSRVAAVFSDNGRGVRGDLAAVVRAILLDNEARSTAVAQGDTYGKLREPVLRLTAMLRAFDARSQSGQYQILSTDDPATQLAQTPLASATVFNYYRPGYAPPGSTSLVAPEMQITDETSVAGYVNFMGNVVMRGIGQRAANGKADVQMDLEGAHALADRPDALVNHVADRLVGPGADAAWLERVTAAVSDVRLPILKADGSNRTAVERGRTNRVRVAILLMVASPGYITQH